MWDEPETEELCNRIPGLDRVLGVGEYKHALPTKTDISPETQKFVTETGRDVFA